MGMSTSVCVGREKTKEYQEKEKAYNACRDAGVELPPALVRYFDEFNMSSPYEETPVRWEEDNSTEEGTNRYVVQLADLPPGTTCVVFKNSW